jgi:hypothetical protein
MAELTEGRTCIATLDAGVLVGTHTLEIQTLPTNSKKISGTRSDAL